MRIEKGIFVCHSYGLVQFLFHIGRDFSGEFGSILEDYDFKATQFLFIL